MIRIYAKQNATCKNEKAGKCIEVLSGLCTESRHRYMIVRVESVNAAASGKQSLKILQLQRFIEKCNYTLPETGFKIPWILGRGENQDR